MATTTISAAAICNAAYAALAKHGPCGTTKVSTIINASVALTYRALELLVANGEVAKYGSGAEELYMVIE